MGYKDENETLANENKTKEAGMVMDRSCTDILCCLIFTAFFVGMLACSGLGYTTGDPMKIFTPFDSDGNQCGLANQTLSNSTLNIERDFTEYKYKYFTGLLNGVKEAASDGADALDNPALFNAVCVKECPTDVPKSQAGLAALGITNPLDKGNQMDCLVNDDVSECPVASYNTTMKFNYCLPDVDEEEMKEQFEQVYAQMNEAFGIGAYVNDLKLAWEVLVIMVFVSLIVTVTYIWLLKCAAKPIIYTSLLLILLLGVGTGFYAYKEVMAIEDKTTDEYKIALTGAIIIWVIVALYLIFLCCFQRAIRLGASIMEASSEFITENKKIVLLPVVMYILCLPVIGWWTTATVFIYGMGTAKYDEFNFVASIENTSQSDYMMLYMLFGLIWIIAFLIAVQIFTTSCTTCLWYFTGHGSDADVKGTYSVWMAMKWGIRYHLGSLAFGSFIVAVVTMIRLMFEYFIYQFEKANPANKENALYKAAKCCIRCYLKCLDTCVKYINKNAYIQIALHNSNFCTGAKESFFLNLRNGGRFSAVAMIGTILSVIGRGVIVATNTFLTIVITDAMVPEVKQPYLAAAIIAFFSYMVAGVFLSLFKDSALTILHCFCLDEELKKDGRSTCNFTPSSLQSFLDVADAEAKHTDEEHKPKANSVE